MDLLDKTYVPVLKECFKCNQEKHWTEFKRNSACKDGLNKYCKDCVTKETKGKE